MNREEKKEKNCYQINIDDIYNNINDEFSVKFILNEHEYEYEYKIHITMNSSG